MGPELLPLEAAVESLYRARFGGTGCSRADEELLTRALAALAEREREAVPY